MQYKSLEDARGKSASNKGKKPNAIEQHKQQEKDRQALIKHQQADLKARKHGEEEDRKKAIKTERCAHAHLQLQHLTPSMKLLHSRMGGCVTKRRSATPSAAATHTEGRSLILCQHPCLRAQPQHALPALCALLSIIAACACRGRWS